jgi:hypothetical protein
MNSLCTLLSGLIDYAGLFPPASLTMQDAVRKYDSYLESQENWVIGRFVLPSGRMAEFHEAREALAPRIPAAWRISLLGTPEEGAKAIEENAGSRAPVTIDTLESKVDSPREIASAAKRVPHELTVYFECPWGQELPEFIAGCAAAGVRVKFRTGGLTPNMIPRTEELAHALVLCKNAATPFKATAGLHHPIRSLQKLSYAADAPTGTMHGFVNVFLAAALLWSGGSEPDALVTLRRDSPESFAFSPTQVSWHTYTLSENQLVEAREQFAISFGSCSFEEPIEDLKGLSWL